MKAILQEGHFKRLKIVQGDRVILGLCLGDYRESYLLQRPVVHPFYTPLGFPVTEMGAHNTPHHRGVWVGHAQLSGINFFHEGEGTGWIVPTEWEVEEADENLRIRMQLEWRDPRGTVIATEERHYDLNQEQDVHILDVISALAPVGGDMRMEPDMHAFMGMRVLDAIDEDDGGQMTSSEGGIGEAEISWEKTGQAVRWVNYSGTLGGHHVGLAALVHPKLSPMPAYAREYGTVFLNPTADRVVEVPEDEMFPFAARFVAYDGVLSDERLDNLWESFGDASLLGNS